MADGAPTPDVVPAMEAAVDDAERPGSRADRRASGRAPPRPPADLRRPDDGLDGLAEHDLSVAAPAPVTDDPELTAFDGLLEPDAAEPTAPRPVDGRATAAESVADGQPSASRPLRSRRERERPGGRTRRPRRRRDPAGLTP